MATHEITLSVNGKTYSATVQPRLSLADFLRQELGLTGVHLGCEHGVCGACTVLVDGLAARGCLMLAVQSHGREVRTVEGLAAGGDLDPLQTALWHRHGLQCGFCTPGILMSLSEYLASDEPVTEAGIRDVLSGHLCRCTGYQNIVAAVLEAAPEMRGAGASGGGRQDGGTG